MSTTVADLGSSVDEALFRPSERESESEKDQRASGKDQRAVGNHQREFSLLRSLSHGVNWHPKTIFPKLHEIEKQLVRHCTKRSIWSVHRLSVTLYSADMTKVSPDFCCGSCNLQICWPNCTCTWSASKVHKTTEITQILFPDLFIQTKTETKSGWRPIYSCHYLIGQSVTWSWNATANQW